MTKQNFSLIDLNLARSPFRNRTFFWLGMILVLLLSAGICVWTVVDAAKARKLQKERAATKKSIEQVTARDLAELEAAKKRAAAAGTRLSREQEIGIQEAVALAEKREVSWTRLLGQLEREMPSKMRVIQIGFAPEKKGGEEVVMKDNRRGVPLVISVLAEKPEIVTQFIRDADRRGIFRFDPTAQVIDSKSQGTAEIQFQMKGFYFPDGGGAPSGSVPKEVRQ
jgi:hypothetical protein